jgi:hypothetical protein
VSRSRLMDEHGKTQNTNYRLQPFTIHESDVHISDQCCLTWYTLHATLRRRVPFTVIHQILHLAASRTYSVVLLPLRDHSTDEVCNHYAGLSAWGPHKFTAVKACPLQLVAATGSDDGSRLGICTANIGTAAVCRIYLARVDERRY